MRISDWSSDVCSSDLLTLLLQMLAFLVPHYMALALPAAFFLGVLLAFSRLHQNRELDALGSAGIGLRRLLSPVLLLALVLTAPSAVRSEEHTSELQSLMRISYAVSCLKKKK